MLIVTKLFLTILPITSSSLFQNLQLTTFPQPSRYASSVPINFVEFFLEFHMYHLGFNIKDLSINCSLSFHELAQSTNDTYIFNISNEIQLNNYKECERTLVELKTYGMAAIFIINKEMENLARTAFEKVNPSITIPFVLLKAYGKTFHYYDKIMIFSTVNNNQTFLDSTEHNLAENSSFKVDGVDSNSLILQSLENASDKNIETCSLPINQPWIFSIKISGFRIRINNVLIEFSLNITDYSSWSAVNIFADGRQENCTIESTGLKTIVYYCPEFASEADDYILFLENKHSICEFKATSYNLALDAKFKNSDKELISTLNDLQNNSLSTCTRMEQSSFLYIDFPTFYSIEITCLFIREITSASGKFHIQLSFLTFQTKYCQLARNISSTIDFWMKIPCPFEDKSLKIENMGVEFLLDEIEFYSRNKTYVAPDFDLGTTTNLVLNGFSEWIAGDVGDDSYLLNDNLNDTCNSITNINKDEILWYTFFWRESAIRAFLIRIKETILSDEIITLKFTSLNDQVTIKEINLFKPNNTADYNADKARTKDFNWNPIYPCLSSDLLVNWGSKQLTYFSPLIELVFDKFKSIFEIYQIRFTAPTEQNSIEISSYYKQHYAFLNTIIPFTMDFSKIHFPRNTEKRVCQSDIKVKRGNNLINCTNGHVGSEIVFSSLIENIAKIEICEIAIWAKKIIYQPSFLLKLVENSKANKLIDLDGPSRLTGITIIPSNGFLNNYISDFLFNSFLF
ncbi:DgyrCDS12926 [Dimorphilus gyrociliatus]|uniref:DgyrCDS12926 n=1 Tax=Dimorphilus gyrociliatus TaxID=2664684 RepID=A0A7I8W955_9ANNE|nr:DgyrCDS12926 [Dimorphilus gyrociliatus]